MPRVQYHGHDPDGQDLVIDGQTVHVGQGKQAEVSRAIADELKSRDGWSEVKDPGGAKAKAKE